MKPILFDPEDEHDAIAVMERLVAAAETESADDTPDAQGAVWRVAWDAVKERCGIRAEVWE
jgi:hypothetical protein